MAYGEQFIARPPIAYTIHVWPTRDLVTKSWTWSDRWRAAYRQMAWAISLAAATQVLDGGTFARREIGLESDIGWVKFTISQVATTVHIVVSEFSGPNAPGPDGGGEAQPHAIDGLVIGLRSGANGTFHVVVFHGSAPTIPCTNRYYLHGSNEVSYSVDRTQMDCRTGLNISWDKDQYLDDAALIAWARALPRDIQAHPTADAIMVHGGSMENIASIDRTSEAVGVREGVGIASFIWPEIDCSADGVQGTNLGVAPTENMHRKSQTPRQRNSDYQLQ